MKDEGMLRAARADDHNARALEEVQAAVRRILAAGGHGQIVITVYQSRLTTIKETCDRKL